MDPMVVINELLSGIDPDGDVPSGDANGSYKVYVLCVYVNRQRAMLEVTARHQGDGKWDVLSVGCKMV